MISKPKYNSNYKFLKINLLIKEVMKVQKIVAKVALVLIHQVMNLELNKETVS
jgi:hypothetical protein